jgi:hypothetical protein
MAVESLVFSDFAEADVWRSSVRADLPSSTTAEHERPSESENIVGFEAKNKRGEVAVFSLPSLEGFGRVAWLAEFIYVNEVSAEVVCSQTEALVVG